MGDVLQLQSATDLPVPPVAGLEPLLTIDQLIAWTGYSRSLIQTHRYRADNPLPTIGTVAGPRFLPSEVLAWMRDEYARATRIEAAR